MAQGIVNRVVPSSAFALGVVRSVVHGTFLVSVLFTSFSATGTLPATILRPTGAMQLLPWSFYAQLQTPSAMVLLKTVMVLSLLLSTARISYRKFRRIVKTSGKKSGQYSTKATTPSLSSKAPSPKVFAVARRSSTAITASRQWDAVLCTGDVPLRRMK